MEEDKTFVDLLKKYMRYDKCALARMLVERDIQEHKMRNPNWEYEKPQESFNYCVNWPGYIVNTTEDAATHPNLEKS